MAISDQLTEIYNNVPLVYEAGYEKGKAEGGDNPFYFITTCNNILGGANFPEGLEAVFRLKYVPITTGWMFNNSTGCKSIKLICDSEQTASIKCESMFAIGSKTPTLELIDLTEFPRRYKERLNLFCNKQTKLKTILGTLDISEATNTSNMFGDCTALTDIEFVPNTIPISISFANSPNLSDYSIQSIIDGLISITDGVARSVTFHKSIALTSPQISIIEGKGWDLVQ